MKLSKYVPRGRQFLVLLGWVQFSALGAFAHPMGNFSINHYAKITVGARSIQILYLLDFAEIPTYQDVRQYGLSPQNDDKALDHYLSTQANLLGAGLTVEDNGHPLHLECISRQAVFAEGAGGLATLKLGLVYRVALRPVTDASSRQLTYTDNNYPGHAGWKEVVVAGEQGVFILSTSAPRTDRSQELTAYPADLLNSPPQQLAATIEFTGLPLIPGRIKSPTGIQARNPGSAMNLGMRLPNSKPNSVLVPPFAHEQLAALPSPQSAAAKQGVIQLRAGAPSTPRSYFTQLILTQGSLGFWVLLSTAFIAAGLGALHALEPGHGKTIVAAYLVGSRGTARHAVLLGFVVTATHTAGVYLLGLITLYASRYIVPEQLYPWLGMISGLTVAGLGVFMFLRHLTGQTGDHSHAPGEQHAHWFASVFKKSLSSQPVATDQSERPISLRQLCALGVTGGIVPCPAALVVLLSAFSLRRIGFGLFLITAFSVGLALVLVGVGLTMVYAKRFIARVSPSGPLQYYLPLLSAAFMVILGMGFVLSAFTSTFGSSFAFASKGAFLPFLTLTPLGLLLGMRHSTDPDHVVAVSTIVSRQGSIKSSATIGALWGLGHTLTIFLVGSAIIIFGVVIPPRLGLAMEFSVALMLILLGMLNLTGLMSWITARLTPDLRIHPGRSVSDHKNVADRILISLGAYQTFRPLVIGLVHGLAGSAAVALLVLSTIKSPFWATAYLLVFGVGTMAGMILMTMAMSLPLVYTSKRYVRTTRFITTTSGVVSVAFGIFLVYQIGVVNGLFTAHPHWIPS